MRRDAHVQRTPAIDPAMAAARGSAPPNSVAASGVLGVGCFVAAGIAVDAEPSKVHIVLVCERINERELASHYTAGLRIPK